MAPVKTMKARPNPGFLKKVSIFFCICGGWVTWHFFSFHSNLNESVAPKSDFEVEGLPPDDAAVHVKKADIEGKGAWNTTGHFRFNRRRAEDALSALGPNAIRKTLAAYVEPPMKDEVPHTDHSGDPKQEPPPEFVVPLPLRLTTPELLTKFEYPKLQTCHNLQANLPVDRGLGFQNVRNSKSLEDPLAEAPHCPADADPFLPWLHDVFPSFDGTTVHFVAQNKRRCNTGGKFQKDLKRLEPQVINMQPISVKRLDEEEARRLAPELWHPENGKENERIPRYRLASFEDADGDAQFTRFVCRFHAADFSSVGNRSLIIGETLSTYPFNYEFLNHRKGRPTMITPMGKDYDKFWLSTFLFDCPLPPIEELRQVVANGESVLSDGTPTIHVDLVPLRTSPRFDEVHFSEGMTNSEKGRFDPKKSWGDRNVMPRVEASGRWENIPICRPPQPAQIDKDYDINNGKEAGLQPSREKPHSLVACTWASATFSLRGNYHSLNDTIPRLEEWIEYHLLVGFDHIYVYDNSAANTKETSLSETISKFSPKEVTRIDWPSRICNNNKGQENPAERSSQYAAESSCLHRYGPYTEWLVSLDTDEYLVPMGDYVNLKDVLRDAAKEGTQILKFKSTRAKPNMKFMEPHIYDGGRCGADRERRDCLLKRENVTFLETYNCDTPIPKPKSGDRARKEIIRPEYVLHHYVHYSVATKKSVESYRDAPTGTWARKFFENASVERYTNEMEEALMLHAKTMVPDWTRGWSENCHVNFEKKKGTCHIGNPWPNNTVLEGGHDKNGFRYNCFSNDRLTNIWIPRLHKAMEKRGTRRLINYAP